MSYEYVFNKYEDLKEAMRNKQGVKIGDDIGKLIQLDIPNPHFPNCVNVEIITENNTTISFSEILIFDIKIMSHLESKVREYT